MLQVTIMNKFNEECVWEQQLPLEGQYIGILLVQMVKGVPLCAVPAHIRGFAVFHCVSQKPELLQTWLLAEAVVIHDCETCVEVD